MALVGAACGTGGGGVELVDPTPTLFAEGDADAAADQPESSIDEGTEVHQESVLPIPSPRGGGLGVIEIAEIAVPVTSETIDGWEVESPCGVIVEITAPEPGPAGLVVLAPGHGGADDGASGQNPDLREADLNLAVARATAEALAERGVASLLTRAGDRAIPASARAALADPSGALVFVSIHHRDTDGPLSVRPGTEVFHQAGSDDSRRLGGLVHEEMEAVLTLAGVDWAAPTEPGVKPLLNQRGSDYFTVLRDTPATASVLVEVASIASPSGAAFLATPEAVEREADALTEAVVRYFTSDDAGGGYVVPAERVREAPSGGGAIECIDPVAPPAD